MCVQVCLIVAKGLGAYLVCRSGNALSRSGGAYRFIVFQILLDGIFEALLLTRIPVYGAICGV